MIFVFAFHEFMDHQQYVQLVILITIGSPLVHRVSVRKDTIMSMIIASYIVLELIFVLKIIKFVISHCTGSETECDGM